MKQAAEGHASRAQLLFAVLLPALWGFFLCLVLVAAITDSESAAIVWLAPALATCCVAIVMIMARRHSTERSPWPCALGSIPATLLGPLAILLLLVPRIRHGLMGALARRPVSGWQPEPDPLLRPTASDTPPAAPAVAPAARTDAPGPPEPDLGAPAVSAQLAAPRRPKTVLALVGLLIGSIVAGAAAFIALLVLVVLGGGDYTGPKSGGHYLYPHSYEVLLLIGAGVAAAGAVGVALWWFESGTTMQRLAIALPAAALALASIAGLTGFLWSQAGADSRPTNVARPTISGSARVGVRLKADEGVWDEHLWTPSNDCLRQRGCYVFSFAWQRCEPRALSCRMIEGATGATELVTPVVVGYRLRVMVTAENDAGSRSAQSRPTAVVVRG